MPTVVQSPIGGAGQQFFDNNGNVLSGGLLYIYAAGTTTPQTTYTTSSGTVARTNPVVLDSAGRVSGDGVWLLLGYAYKFVLKNSTGATTYGTWDNISGGTSGITVAATVAALALITGMNDGARILVTDWGFYRFSSASTATVNGGTVVTAAGGTGRWLLEVNGVTWNSTINVKQYGATGDGTTDDAAAITAAIAAIPATGGTLFFPPGTYKITTALTLTRAYTHVLGYGAKIVQATSITRMFSVTASDVTIEGLWLYGKGTDWNASANTDALGVYFYQVDNGRVLNCRIENFGSSGVQFYQASNVLVQGNTIIGIGAAGGLVSGSNYNFGIHGYLSGISDPGVRLVDNHIKDAAQGILLDNDFKDVVIEGNVISNIIGQHGIYLGSITNATITGNIVTTCGNTGIKAQLAANDTLDATGITISSNAVKSAVGAGILITRTAGSLFFRDVAVVGNTIETTGLGIQLTHCDSYNVSANVVRESTSYGIFCATSCRDGAVNGNLVQGTDWTGLYAGAEANYRTFVANNSLIEVGRTGDVADPTNTAKWSGMYVSGGEVDVFRNVVDVVSPAYIYNLTGTASASIALVDNRFPATKLVRNDGMTREAAGNDMGDWYLYTDTFHKGRGNRREFHGTADPVTLGSTEAFYRGDRVWNQAPTAGAPVGWVCTTAGSPGTWKVFGRSEIDGSTTWNPGSIADGDMEAKDITVTGAALGDYAIVSFSLDVMDLTLTGSVTAADTVTAVLANNTGAPVDLGSGTIRARVMKA